MFFLKCTEKRRHDTAQKDRDISKCLQICQSPIPMNQRHFYFFSYLIQTGKYGTLPTLLSDCDKLVVKALLFRAADTLK